MPLQVVNELMGTCVQVCELLNMLQAVWDQALWLGEHYLTYWTSMTFVLNTI